MGGPVDSDDDDECLFRECEKILLGIPRTSSDIFSCALTMKQLVAQLPIGCASDVSLKKVRQASAALAAEPAFLVSCPRDCYTTMRIVHQQIGS